MSQDRLRKILKARGWVWKRTRYKQPNGAAPQVKLAKKADLDWLFWAHSAGEIRLKFLDESGFSLWSPVSYTYARLGEQKVLACIIHEDFGKSSKALARSSSSDLAEKQSVF